MNERDELVLGAVSGRRVSRTGWVRADCPFCELRIGKADKRQCLGLEVETGSWHCFRCGTAGLLVEVPDDIETRRPAEREAPKTKIELPPGFMLLYEEPAISIWAADPARDYLANRGFAEDVVREARIGVVLVGRYRGRVVVPVYDADGSVLLGWSARTYVESPFPKYLYPEGMNRREIVYNHAALLRATDDPAFAVEGVFDALALWPDGVACLGKPSAPQVEAFAAAKRPVVALLDGDAWRESEALAMKLRLLGQRSAFLRLPPAKDPATVDRAKIRRDAAALLAQG